LPVGSIHRLDGRLDRRAQTMSSLRKGDKGRGAQVQTLPQ
jgi:hypothetical protein